MFRVLISLLVLAFCIAPAAAGKSTKSKLSSSKTERAKYKKNKFRRAKARNRHRKAAAKSKRLAAATQKSSSGKEIRILSSGNPAHLLKGKDDIKHALCLVAKACPHLDFYLTVVCGERIPEQENVFGDVPGNVICRIK